MAYYLNDSQVLQRVADALKVANVGDLPDYWARHATDANEFAYNEVRGRLIRRGCTAEQVDQWDRREEYAKSLSLWQALVLGGCLEGFDKRFIDSLDRREELDTAIFYVSGKWLRPDEQPGQARTGGFTQSGVFNGPEPADAPDYTRW